MITKTYKDMVVQALDKTPITSELTKYACNLTQKKATDISEDKLSPALGAFLVEAEHTSVFEHCNLCLSIHGVSRAFLAQVTRHRMFSFTSASQHYQNYYNMPIVISDQISARRRMLLEACCDSAIETYRVLVESGEVSLEEARMVLPNACSVSLVMTGNARAWANFLSQRLCERNVREMVLFSRRVHTICKKWFPELFSNIGSYCQIHGRCNQGEMTCGKMDKFHEL